MQVKVLTDGPHHPRKYEACRDTVRSPVRAVQLFRRMPKHREISQESVVE